MSEKKDSGQEGCVRALPPHDYELAATLAASRTQLLETCLPPKATGLTPGRPGRMPASIGPTSIAGMTDVFWHQ